MLSLYATTLIRMDCAMDYNRFISHRAQGFILPSLAFWGKLLQAIPDTVNLQYGDPNTLTSAIVDVTYGLRDGRQMKLEGDEMLALLVYGSENGTKALTETCSRLVQRLHSPPCWGQNGENSTEVKLSVGAQDAINKVLDITVNPGDYVITESIAYPGALAAIRSAGGVPLAVDHDEDGMKPESLGECLSRWKPSDVMDPESNIPKVMYLVPHGHNPTGRNLSLERKKSIYQIAQEYNLLIVEDDPYALLTYDEPLPSLLSMDTDGRVIHINSFSKTFNPGLRVGYICGPKLIMKKYSGMMSNSVNYPCTLAQAFINKFFDMYGIDGFLDHTRRLAEDYKNRKNLAVTLARKYLKDLVEFHEPQCGFFLWMKITNPKMKASQLFNEKARKHKVWFVPGDAFSADLDSHHDFIRIAFSYASEEVLEKGFSRLRSILLEDSAT